MCMNDMHNMRRLFRPWWKSLVFLFVTFFLLAVILRIHYFASRPDCPEEWHLVHLGMTHSEVDALNLGIDPDATRDLKGQDMVQRFTDGQRQELIIVYGYNSGEARVTSISARLTSRFMFKGDNVYFVKR